MSKKYVVKPKLFFASIISFGNFICPGFPEKTQFKLPTREIPQRTMPGGSRNNRQCFSNVEQTSMTPLVPGNNFGFTLVEHPTIFIHVPITSAKKAFFSIQDLDGDFYYQTEILLPKQPGAVGISLSTAAQPLKINNNYHWSLALICGSQLEPDDPQVNGLIKRVKLDSASSQLSELEVSHQSVCLLSQKGIWYDLLKYLAKLRQENPENSLFVNYWEQLLTNIGLKAIARDPLFYQ